MGKNLERKFKHRALRLKKDEYGLDHFLQLQIGLYTTLAVTGVIRAGAVALAGQCWSEPVETGATANLLSPSSWSPGCQPAYNDTFIEVQTAKGRSKVAASPYEATIDFP